MQKQLVSLHQQLPNSVKQIGKKELPSHPPRVWLANLLSCEILKIEMNKLKEIKKGVEDIVAVYKNGILAIERIIDETYKMVEEFKKVREEIGPALRENLAKSRSLRKKDFDKLMSGIYLQQSQREKEFKQILMDFLKEQKKVASELEDALAKNEKNELKRVRKTEFQIGERIEEVEKLLGNFRKEQTEIGANLYNFLQNNESPRIKDFKHIIGRIQLRQKEREEARKLMRDIPIQRGDRRSEADRMLADFCKETEELVSSWRSVVTMVEKKSLFKKEE